MTLRPAPHPGSVQASDFGGGGEDDYLDQLEKLTDLRAQDVLTEEEFTAKKQRTLGL